LLKRGITRAYVNKLVFHSKDAYLLRRHSISIWS